MTTFLLPQGNFHYLRAPMGLNASSNKRCCHSDVIIRGLPWARKIVDDNLIWAETEMELLDRARIVLTCCKENNITISQKKLEFSNRIKYAGHIILDEGLRARQREICSNSAISGAKKSPGPTGIHRCSQPTGNVHPRLGTHDKPTMPTHEKGHSLGVAPRT